jgi:hypothetical protein
MVFNQKNEIGFKPASKPREQLAPFPRVSLAADYGRAPKVLCSIIHCFFGERSTRLLSMF